MKKHWNRLFALGLALALVVGSACAGEKIMLGQIVTSLTGDAAMYGDFQVNAVRMAIDEINAAGGIDGKMLDVVYLDDQSKPQVALQAMQKLVSEVKPVAVFGPDWSGNTLAAMPIAQRNKIPQLTTSKSRAITHKNNPYIYRLVAMGPFIGQALAEYAKEQGFKKVAIFYTNTEYGVSGGEGALEACKKLGLEVTAYETCNVGDNDFTAQIQTIKNSGAEVLIDYSIQVEGAKSLKQMRELGMNLPVLGGDAFVTDDFAKLVGNDIMDGIIAASSFIPTAETPKVEKFVEDYKAKFGNVPEDHASPLYDGVYILAEAIKRAGSTDREKINAELAKTSGFEGVNGPHTADKWNNLLHSCMLAEYKNGGWVYIKTLTGLEDHDD